MRGWRRFDAYAKAVEGIQERTIGGGIITLLSFLFVFFLFISEVSVWWTVNVLHRMHVDTMPQESPITLDVDISMLHESCKDIKVDVSDVQGDTSILIAKDLQEIPLIDPENPYNEGCRYKGTLTIQKLQGDIFFCHGGSLSIFNLMEMFEFNSSHVITKLNFGPSIPEMETPLTDVHKTVMAQVATYKYFAKVVPSRYVYLDGASTMTYQYSVTEHLVQTEGFVTNIPGVIISYDFSPIAVEYIETKPNIFHFITNTCAIVGGVIAVARIFDAALYSMSKKLD
ncbi:hypothetical protein ABG067_003172 [Albugo candida]